MKKPWETEPDWKHFTARGFPLVVLRNPDMKNLCGYIGVPPEHPWHGMPYDDVGADVHCGFTFGANHLPAGHPKSKDIKVAIDNVWWLGFDCAHGGDLVPGLLRYKEMAKYHADDVYRTMEYVVDELLNLANQAHDAKVPST